uniref:Uncharacterized protein n=1 Tax=Fibrocapsa japonica TaxID=94617 RepID=A0A7S2XYC4_9STRA|mmetsp:Transcript_2604/g.3823  ORF Transcript_2604/g.3823 Transcript_2604/m.3823 type:complete len:141 (+) Transcript_2604:155-577(+)
MKLSHLILLLQIFFAANSCSAFAPMKIIPNKIKSFETSDTTASFTGPVTLALHSAPGKIMNDMDMMCIANTADLCNMYQECDTEEREAILNRFEQQTDALAERLAMMQGLTNHMKTGDTLTEEEVSTLKANILGFLSSKQ